MKRGIAVGALGERAEYPPRVNDVAVRSSTMIPRGRRWAPRPDQESRIKNHMALAVQDRLGAGKGVSAELKKSRIGVSERSAETVISVHSQRTMMDQRVGL